MIVFSVWLKRKWEMENPTNNVLHRCKLNWEHLLESCKTIIEPYVDAFINVIPD